MDIDLTHEISLPAEAVVGRQLAQSRFLEHNSWMRDRFIPPLLALARLNRPIELGKLVLTITESYTRILIDSGGSARINFWVMRLQLLESIVDAIGILDVEVRQALLLTLADATAEAPQPPPSGL